MDLAVNERRLSLNSLAEAEVHGCAGTQSKRRWGKGVSTKCFTPERLSQH